MSEVGILPSPVVSPPARGIRIQPPAPAPQPTASGNSSQHSHTNVFSPVNQNGSYEFDRVLKSGEVLKRTRKTKTWKSVYLVLRPNTLSVYRDQEETKLRHQIRLAELTAVARQKDPKRKAQHVFGLFTPARNYHLGAPSERDAQEWVEMIRNEARIDEDEETLGIGSPTGGRTTGGDGHGASLKHTSRPRGSRIEPLWSDTSEAEPDAPRRPSSSLAHDLVGLRRPSYPLALSGNEQGSFSDFSDGPSGGGGGNGRTSTTNYLSSSTSLPHPSSTSHASPHPAGPLAPNPTDEDKVMCHGWLHALHRRPGGVHQWRRVWAVLRPRHLALYKNEQEYAASRILPLAAVLDAGELDPLSRSKRHCFQLIAEDRSYRFCAPDEEACVRWLAAAKVLVARRREGEGRAGAVKMVMVEGQGERREVVPAPVGMPVTAR